MSDSKAEATPESPLTKDSSLKAPSPTEADVSDVASNIGTAPPTPGFEPLTPGLPITPGPHMHSRSTSFSASSNYNGEDEMEGIPPMDRLTIFDFLENLALPQRLERWQKSVSASTEKVRRQQEKLSVNARKRVVEEWRKRVPGPDEQLDKYRKRMRTSVDRLGRRWKETQNVTLREKISFIAGVLNIFISGYLVGAFPQYFHWWYTAQLAYFYPIRFYTYHKRGYHYFLVDLCYFVNLLLLLSIWAFPQSKRLFISTFCLAFGNNAVAIAMWRNSLVFHSLDKVTSLFIHIMPCVTIHCMVHLSSPDQQAIRFPAIYSIKYSLPGSPEHYSLPSMIVWATVPYATWQLAYHFLITVQRRDKIAAGRPTSFTWLRRSYSKVWIGKIVLSLPEALQEPAFMLIQYIYALLTMVPAPLWFWSGWASSAFLFGVFTWSVYNGAVYYIDVFGTRFQKELDQLKKDVAKWQMSPDISAKTPGSEMGGLDSALSGKSGELGELSLGAAAQDGGIGEVTRKDYFPDTSGKSSAPASEDFSIIDRSSGDFSAAASTALERQEQGSGVDDLRSRAGPK